MMRKIVLTMMALLVCVALLPVTAGVAEVNITNETIPGIETGIRNAISGLPAGGGNVTVTGVKTEADVTLKMSIPENVTVVWKAEYSGGVNEDELISVTGGGIFEVAEGGKVSVAVEADGEEGAGATAISAIGAEDGSISIMVTGGMVEATAKGGGVSLMDLAVAINVENGAVIVTDGRVSATAEYGELYDMAVAVFIKDGTVTVTGGIVEAISDVFLFAISANGASVITVDGGTVKATNEGDKFGIMACSVNGEFICIDTLDALVQFV